MKPDWIVVADAFRARVFEQAGRQGALSAIGALVHPEGRMHPSEYGADKQGHTEKGDTGSTSYAPHTEPKEIERERFAREIVAYLETGAREARFASIALYAEPHMLGEIRRHMSADLARSVRVEQAVDYAALSPHEIEQRLAAS